MTPLAPVVFRALDRVAAGVPVDLSRDEARRLARRELADPSYDAEPGLLERAVGWVLDRLRDLLEASAAVSPGSWAGLAVLLGLVVLAVVVVRRRTGPLAGSARTAGEVFDAAPRSAAEHLRAADEAAAAGDWSTAVVERFRAVVRSLEERALLDPRPGRTADEVAREAGALLPEAGAALLTAAAVFDAVRYGGRPGTAGDDTRLRETDEAVRRARPRTSAPSPASLVAPR